MTDPSPRLVWYEYEFELFHPVTGYETIHVESFEPSVDIDRVPYCAATLTIARPSDDAWAAMDSRTDDRPRVFFRVYQKAYDDDGAEVTVFPLPYMSDGTGNQTGELIIRRAQRNWPSGSVTLDLVGREIMLEDKRRVAGTTINTAATTVSGLIGWSLTDIFGGFSLSADAIVSSTAIPAGDRRLMLQGETHSQLIEPELQAIGCRLFDLWGRTWHAKLRDNAPTYIGAPTTVELGTFVTDSYDTLPADVDPIVTGLDEVVESGGDWADGVLVKGSYTDAGGTRIEWYQASGAGANTRARVINVERAAPSSNMADEIVARTVIRGHNIEVTARNRFDVLPGMDLVVHVRGGGTLTGSIRAVAWDTESGLMRIRAQSGDPL